MAAGLGIRIHFMLILIQNQDFEIHADPDPCLGFSFLCVYFYMT